MLITVQRLVPRNPKYVILLTNKLVIQIMILIIQNALKQNAGTVLIVLLSWSFDESQVTVCIQKSKNECVVGLPHQLSESRCYIKSHSTYRWNPSTLKCEKCVATQVTNETPHEDSFQLLFTSIILMLIIVAI
ncbi:unnamed protein product (macronuclear) [Paramecium tetraurelia]|uniref:Uncharacterized protein n=1 Tax=Paramecium tetraurelia TaxID=5888 RepID=A0CNX7_PARTE|nr:uncharacterized protein GSPATT00038763001 [Paramecium tetraurelia]CAK72494.1 unnamed protein product [Paramecium tetraurelia]|eukprot:XP_001439891.1 hypothetical protein (macronuclear) [Paramecium tetraurelia strain d4-2]